MTVAIIGSGNMSQYLVSKMIRKVALVALYSQNSITSTTLSKKYNIAVKSLREIATLKPDAIILAVNDDSIASVAKQLKNLPSLIIHCSGSTPIEVLTKYCKYAAVMWPLISISQQSKPKNNFPVCIEATDEKSLASVHRLCKIITNEIYVYSSVQRLRLHLMAVVVNNFTNHLYHIASQIANSENLDFDIVKDLIAQTTANILNHPPAEMQTGPAKRNDTKTMLRHLQLLKSNNHKALYKIISDDIFATARKIKDK